MTVVWLKSIARDSKVYHKSISLPQTPLSGGVLAAVWLSSRPVEDKTMQGNTSVKAPWPSRGACGQSLLLSGRP